MIGHGAKFGRKKEQAIAALLTEPNAKEAARVAGIGSATLLRWLKEPELTLPSDTFLRGGPSMGTKCSKLKRMMGSLSDHLSPPAPNRNHLSQPYRNLTIFGAESA